MVNNRSLSTVYTENTRDKRMDEFLSNWLGSDEICLESKIKGGSGFKNSLNRYIHSHRSLYFPRKYGYHFVLSSIWPICVGFIIMLLMVTFIGYLNTGSYSGLLFVLFLNLIILLGVWFSQFILLFFYTYFDKGHCVVFSTLVPYGLVPEYRYTLSQSYSYEILDCRVFGIINF